MGYLIREPRTNYFTSNIPTLSWYSGGGHSETLELGTPGDTVELVTPGTLWVGHSLCSGNLGSGVGHSAGRLWVAHSRKTLRLGTPGTLELGTPGRRRVAGEEES